MSQHIQQQHQQYVHYTPPPPLPFTHVAPKDTQHQPQSQSQPQQQPQIQPQQPQQQAAQGSSSTSAPLVATGDWTKDLVHLAKTAELKCVFIIDVSRIFNLSDPLIVVSLLQLITELTITSYLRKHALTLQLHTAHILSAHASLEQKGKAIQDLREQKNKCVIVELIVIAEILTSSIQSSQA